MAANGPPAPLSGMLGTQRQKGLDGFGDLSNIPPLLRPGLLQAAIARASLGQSSTAPRTVAPLYGGATTLAAASFPLEATPIQAVRQMEQKVSHCSGQPAWIPTETSRSLAPVRREYKRGSAVLADSMGLDPDQLELARQSYRGPS